jgi:hypothetical protein
MSPVRLNFRILPTALIVSLSFVAPAAAQQPKVLAPHKPVAPILTPPRPLAPAAQQSAVGGLWMTDANMKSSLYLKSDLKTSPLTVTPILYLSNGVSYPLPAVTLPPSGTAVVDINQSLAQQGIAPYATLYGYVEIDYQWPWAVVCATVRNVDFVNSLIFANGLQPPPAGFPKEASLPVPQTTHSFEGLWWKQENNVTGFVALANITEQPINATLRLTDSNDAQLETDAVTISPHSTKMLTLTQLPLTSAVSGGIYLTHDGTEHGLVVNGGLEDQSVGYSARLALSASPQPPAAGTSPTVSEFTFAELGLMSGAADPMMNFPAGTVFTPYSLVRNISGQSATVTPTVWWMAAGAPHSAQLGQVTIAPHQTLNLNVPALIAAAGLQNYNGSINLILAANGQNDALALASGSVDKKNTYVFEVIARGVAESASKSIPYWSTANGDDTMVTLWNPADEDQDLLYTLFFSGGLYLYPIHLPARATRTFNISEITGSATPDSEGNIIPAGIHEGSAEIAGSQGEHQHILVNMDTGIYNVNKAVCAPPTCETCQGLVSIAVIEIPFAVPVSGTTQETFYMTWSSGTQYNLTNQSTWSSNATSVATVSVGLVSGVSAGAATITAFDSNDEPPYIPDYCYMYGNGACPAGGPTGGSGSGCVFGINAVSPSTFVVGTTGTITISGCGFSGKQTPNVLFDGTGITSTNAIVVNDSEIQANYSVACDAQPQNVYVQFPSFDDVKTNLWPVGEALPEAPTPTITFLGTNIVGTTPSVVVGQQIALTASVTSLPACMSMGSQSWSTPTGAPIAGYTNAAGNGQPDATGGKVQALPGNATANYTFYWVFPVPTGQQPASFQLAYLYSQLDLSNGQRNTGTAALNFAVSGPTGVTMKSTAATAVTIDDWTANGSCTSPNPAAPYLVDGNVTWSVVNGICLSSGTYGFTSSPSTNPSGGTLFWVQLVNSGSASGGLSCTVVPGLDNAGSSSYQYAYVHAGNIAYDFPAAPLLSTYTSLSRTENLTMYLMWKSNTNTANAIPVPIGDQPWGFNGSASCASSCGSASSWTANTQSAGLQGSFHAAAATDPNYGYPTWNTVGACK